jgi:hypothetical protein
MNLGGVKITTPFDNPSQYQPDWRHHVAKLIHDNVSIRVPIELRFDPWVQKQIRFLNSAQGSDENLGFLNRQWQIERMANDIYVEMDETNVRAYLEALLLTDQPFDVVAKDMNQTVDMVRYYERVYWSCRTEDGYASPSEMLRTSFAQGIEPELISGTAQYRMMWRMVGAKYGYTALTYVLNWQHPAGKLDADADVFQLMARTNIGTLLKRSIQGRMEPIDANATIGQYINFERLRHETKSSGRNEAMELMNEMFKVMAPKMQDAEQSGTALLNYHAAGRERQLQAQNAIDQVQAPDQGAERATAILKGELEKALRPMANQYKESHP